MELIDSHVHLLYPEKFSYAWCAAQPTLNRAYRLEEYRAAATAAPAGVTVRSLVYLEADVPVTQQEAEADFFGQLARTDRGRPPVAAVIAGSRALPPIRKVVILMQENRCDDGGARGGAQ